MFAQAVVPDAPANVSPCVELKSAYTKSAVGLSSPAVERFFVEGSGD